jgi:hypothetical protein
LPAFCISAARMIVDLSQRIKNVKINNILPFAVISAIGAFGLLSTTILITTNVTSSYFNVYLFIVQYLANQRNNSDDDSDITTPNDEDKITMVGRHWTRSFFWIPRYVFDMNLDFIKINELNDMPMPEANDRFLLILDNRIWHLLASNRDMSSERDFSAYYITYPVAIFKDKTTHYDISKYPFASMSENRDTRWVQIREYNLSSNSSSFAGE